MFSSPTKNFEHTMIDKTSWRNTAELCLLENHNFPNCFSPSPVSSILIRHLGTTPALTHHTTILSTIVATTGYCTLAKLPVD